MRPISFDSWGTAISIELLDFRHKPASSGLGHLVLKVFVRLFGPDLFGDGLDVFFVE